MSNSQICDFYRGQTVLITGGTGFLGKLLIEKLLRGTDVAKIYLMIREKRGIKIDDRFDKIFEDVIFSKLVNFKNRVEAIYGDCAQDGLGISIDDRRRLILDVNIVFHVAATVNFNENIKTAYAINVNGVEEILKLCHEMENLKSVIDVSTAFSNCHFKSQLIEETLYNYPVDYKTLKTHLAKATTRELEDEIQTKLMPPWPNTYTFTKALSESVIKKSSAALPIGVFRPGIVIATHEDPLEGWIDNLYGPTGVCMAYWCGILRVNRCRDNLPAHIVPADFCVAAMIAAAWDVYDNSQKYSNKSDVKVYNYTSPPALAPTWGHLIRILAATIDKFPSVKSGLILMIVSIESQILYKCARFIAHIIPAIFIDLALILSGNKAKMLRIYKKLHTYCDAVSSFCCTEYKFENKNVEALWDKMSEADREVFRFDMKSLDWNKYYENYIKGVRVYLMKDSLSSLEVARNRQKRLVLLKNILTYVIIFFIAKKLVSWYFSLFDI